MGRPPHNTRPCTLARPTEAKAGMPANSNLTKVTKVVRKLRSTAKLHNRGKTSKVALRNIAIFWWV